MFTAQIKKIKKLYGHCDMGLNIGCCSNLHNTMAEHTGLTQLITDLTDKSKELFFLTDRENERKRLFRRYVNEFAVFADQLDDPPPATICAFVIQFMKWANFERGQTFKFCKGDVSNLVRAICDEDTNFGEYDAAMNELNDDADYNEAISQVRSVRQGDNADVQKAEPCYRADEELLLASCGHDFRGLQMAAILLFLKACKGDASSVLSLHRSVEFTEVVIGGEELIMVCVEKRTRKSGLRLPCNLLLDERASEATKRFLKARKFIDFDEYNHLLFGMPDTAALGTRLNELSIRAGFPSGQFSTRSFEYGCFVEIIVKFNLMDKTMDLAVREAASVCDISYGHDTKDYLIGRANTIIAEADSTATGGGRGNYQSLTVLDLHPDLKDKFAEGKFVRILEY